MSKWIPMTKSVNQIIKEYLERNSSNKPGKETWGLERMINPLKKISKHSGAYKVEAPTYKSPL
jgi:hypothetical protein